MPGRGFGNTPTVFSSQARPVPTSMTARNPTGTSPGKHTMRETCALILAAGEGTRMRSSLAKVLHLLGGTPMIRHVADLCRQRPLKRTLVVGGEPADRVRAALEGEPVEFVVQAEQRGTGHAVRQAEAAPRGVGGGPPGPSRGGRAV